MQACPRQQPVNPEPWIITESSEKRPLRRKFDHYSKFMLTGCNHKKRRYPGETHVQIIPA
jgi:hypothetical protein